jgi:hypothetical protein
LAENGSATKAVAPNHDAHCTIGADAPDLSDTDGRATPWSSAGVVASS